MLDPKFLSFTQVVRDLVYSLLPSEKRFSQLNHEGDIAGNENNEHILLLSPHFQVSDPNPLCFAVMLGDQEPVVGV